MTADLLKLIAPGTPIRDGLENILRAKTGALLLITDNNDVIKEIVDGGFYINEEYTSSKLYELAKMDGAIVLSGDLKRILFANAQLIPSREIETRETGTRHRTAERTAKQTGELVISISQRRNIITIFKGDFRYILKDTNAVLNKANQGIQTLERYKKVFDNKLAILNEYEFNDIVTLKNVIDVIQRAEMVRRISYEIQNQIYELGEDGRLVNMQLQELMGGLEKEEALIIKDYIVVKKSTKNKKTPEKVIEELSKMQYEDMTRETTIAKLLGYDTFDNYDEVGVYTRGYRIINKIPRMPSNIVENLVMSFKSFQHILAADIESLDEVEILESDTPETAEKRKIFHLNLNWFMQTLLDRTDRMSMYNGLEVRVPFCDYKLVEYVWNIPWEMKAYKGREKGLLRYIMEDSLPEEVVYRKKSPYPKTHNPTYLSTVKEMLQKIMQNKNAPINELLNREYILEILKTNGSTFNRPWFGQLMTGPQLIFAK